MDLWDVTLRFFFWQVGNEVSEESVLFILI